MTVKTTVFKDREEWLEARLKYITATEMASLFGLNPYKSGNKVLKEKHGIEKDEFDPNNEYCKRGKELENSVILATGTRLNVRTEAAAEEAEYMVTDEEHRISCTPDAFIWGDKGKKILECKVSGFKNYEKWLKEHPPWYYIMQVHVQMMMCDLKGEGYIAGMFFGDEFPNIPIVILEIKYSEEIEKLMKSTVKSFWSRKVDDKYITPTMLKTHMTDLLKKSIDKTYKSVL